MPSPPSRRKKRKMRELAESSERSVDETDESLSSTVDILPSYDFSSLQGSADYILSNSPSEPSSRPSGSNEPLSALEIHQSPLDSGQINVSVEVNAEQETAVCSPTTVNLSTEDDSSQLCIQTEDPLQVAFQPNLIGQLSHEAKLQQEKFLEENQSILPEIPVSLEQLRGQLITPNNPGMGSSLIFSAFMHTGPREETESSPQCPEETENSPQSPFGSPSWATPPDPTDQQSQNHNPNLPLYEDSEVSVHDCMVSILTFAQSAHLIGKSTSELIELIEILLNNHKPNNFPKTAHMFKKYFKNDTNEIQIYFYCSHCYKSRASSVDVCDECPGSKKVNYFIVSPLDRQLQKLYSRPGFSEKLKYKYNRAKKNMDNIEDIYDGSIYKEAEKGVLGSDKNISLTWYSDGISIYECSTYSLWPCMYTINELPPEDRHKPENILIGGLWGGDGKPHPNIFLLPQYHELKKLNEGIPVKVCDTGEEIVVKGVLLIGTCDVPAKACFMNMKGHSGYFSCPKCFVEGEKSERTGGVLVFPHQDLLDLRNDENYLVCVQQGVLSKDGYKGVFCPTILSFMFSSSFISGMTCDVMHCVYMGCTKQFLKLWFDPKYKGKAFSLCEKIPQINERLNSFNLPHFAQRMLLQVDKSLSFWKASLCRNFLLYVVLVLLKDFLPDTYHNNLCMFVEGISLLNSDSISLADLDRGDQLLCQFCKDFERLYGLRHMSSNLHLVRHLKQCVLECGNLFLNSCFGGEDLNGQIAALVHGTRHAIKQVTSRLELVTDLPLLIKSVHSEDVRNYCEKLTRRCKNFKLGTRIADGDYVVGEYSDISPFFQCVAELVSVVYPNVRFRFFERLYRNRHLFVSSCYEKGSRVSCYCKYKWNGLTYHGLLLTFVETLNDKHFVLLERSFEIPSDLYRYIQFSPSGDKDLVPVSVLICVSFCFEVNGIKYLIDPLNKYELE